MRTLILAALVLFPMYASAQTSFTHATMTECPEGYVCTAVSSSATAAPSASPTSPLEKIFYVSPGHLPEALDDLRMNVPSGSIVAPQTYTVDSGLRGTGSVPAGILEAARARGLRIMPLITNGDNFSQTLAHSLLASSTAQDALISYLVSEAQTQGYIGWQFDFEDIAATDRDLFSAFVARTATALHGRGLILSVAAVARTDDRTSTSGYKNWSGVYDYPSLAKSADFISIMAYDDPNSYGPVASIPYDESVLAYLVNEGVPLDKVSLGVPFYYYGWDQTNPGIGIIRYAGAYSRLQYVRQNYAPHEFFSDYFGVPYLTYQLDGRQYVSWFEDAKSVALKLGLARSRGMRGFSAWDLGVEPPDVWSAIDGF